MREIEEKIITPVMRRIEAEDPERHLVGLEHRLKGRERIEEKATHDVQKKGISAEQALADMKFHTQASFDAKEETHVAYERLRTFLQAERTRKGSHKGVGNPAY